MNAPALFSHDAFVQDAACFALGSITVEHLAALHAMSPAEVLQVLSDPAVAARVDRAVAESQRSGAALRQRARSVIGEAMQKLAVTVSGDDVSPSFLLRVVDVLGKQASEPQDKGQGAQPTFTIHIDLGNQSVSLTGTPQAPGEVIDV